MAPTSWAGPQPNILPTPTCLYHHVSRVQSLAWPRLGRLASAPTPGTLDIALLHPIGPQSRRPVRHSQVVTQPWRVDAESAATLHLTTTSQQSLAERLE
jgi:hypothetical protein